MAKHLPFKPDDPSISRINVIKKHDVAAQVSVVLTEPHWESEAEAVD